MSTIPYTYFLYHKPTGMKYYGYQERVGCNPDNLWKTYYSSSYAVKKLIEEYGKDSFLFQIRKIFPNGKDAFEWEQKVLQKLNAVNKHDWLNNAISSGPFRFAGKYSKPRTQKHKENLSKSLKGRGTKKTKEHIAKISQSLKGHILSEETKKKIGDANRGKKWPQRMTDEIREKLSLAHKGRSKPKHSEETKRKMSESHRGKKRPPMSEEQKKKLSEVHKKRWMETKRKGTG